jgi:hypothetical protein
MASEQHLRNTLHIGAPRATTTNVSALTLSSMSLHYKLLLASKTTMVEMGRQSSLLSASAFLASTLSTCQQPAKAAKVPSLVD